MRKNWTVLAGIIVLLFTGLHADDYTLAEVLALARENNKEIKIARADLKYSSALVKEAISTALPKISITGDYNRNFLENVFYFSITDPETGQQRVNRFKASFTNEYQVNAVLNQTILSFGKVGNAIQGARHYKKLTRYQYTDSYQKVITRVKKAFYQALLLKKVWEVARQSEKSAQENYDIMKIKFEGGAIAEFDLLQAETRWKNAIPETMKARKNYALALNNLKALIDFPLRKSMELSGNLEDFPPLPDSLGEREIFDRRPDYNALVQEKKLQEKRVAVEKANGYPSITGSLIYSYSARSDAFRLENDNDNVILGVNLNIPLFTGGYTSAQVQKARVDVEKAHTRIQMAVDNIRIDIQNILLRLREARQRINAARKSIDTAGRAFEIAQSRVMHGLATQLELKDSRVFLDQANLNYYTAIFDYLDAYFDWQQAVGEISDNTAF